VKHFGNARLAFAQPDTVDRNSGSQHLRTATNNNFPNPTQKTMIELGSGII
jgi:hypothetical protein